MLEGPIRLDREVEIFFTYPFLLGFDIAPMEDDQRKEKIRNLATELNSKIQEYEWSFIDIEEDKWVPDVMSQRKKGLLKGSPREKGGLILKIRALTKDDVLSHFDLTEANETIWYYDWGAGTIDLIFKIRIKDEAGVDHLVNLAKKLFDLTDFYSEEPDHFFIPKFIQGWGRNFEVLLEFLRQGSEKNGTLRRENGQGKWHLRLRFPSAKLLPSHKPSHDETPPVSTYCHYALIMKNALDDELVLTIDQFRRLLESFSGENLGECKYINSLREDGIDTCVDGFNGSVAVLHNSRSGNLELASLAEQIKWNYRLAIFYHTRLRLFIDELARKMSESLNFRREYKLEEVMWFQNKKLQLQLFLNDMSPETVAVDDLIDYRIYNALSEGLKTDKMVEKIEKQLSSLQSYYADSISLQSNWLQTKMNYILIILNVMTCAAVIASLIAIYDIKNQSIDPVWRLLVISLGAGLFGIISSLYIRLTRLK